MEFNKMALNNKDKYLDQILYKNDILERVLNRQTAGKWRAENIPRVWEPGGGSTLYKFWIDDKPYFLKVKHSSVTVESKLEEEADYIHKSSLENEYDVIKELNGRYCPDIAFFDKEEEFDFLAFEYVPYSLTDQLSDSSIEEMLNMWRKLEQAVNGLFEKGFIHCDLHENNIRVRADGSIVIIDYEESRKLTQNYSFKKSLDYIGYNSISVLGEFPLSVKQQYHNHYNCMLRLKELWKEYILKNISGLLKKCNYDSGNGICNTLDHGKSEFIYQSIDTKYLRVKGQRGIFDCRLGILNIITDMLFGNNSFTFIDVGSNNGNFCRNVTEHTDNRARCIGLEGFHEFNVLAKTIAFLEDKDDIEFYDFLCGKDSLEHLNIEKNSFMSICSVYHHIIDKEVFLRQIKLENIDYILFELAVQPECYSGKSWRDELAYIMESLQFSANMLLGYSKDYHRPLVLISRNKLESKTAKKIKIECEKYLSNGDIG